MTTSAKKCWRPRCAAMVLLWGGSRMWTTLQRFARDEADATDRGPASGSARRSWRSPKARRRHEPARRLASSARCRPTARRPNRSIASGSKRSFKAGRAHRRGIPARPAARARRRLFGGRLHGERPRAAQVAHQFPARILSQPAAAADHAAATAARHQSRRNSRSRCRPRR